MFLNNGNCRVLLKLKRKPFNKAIIYVSQSMEELEEQNTKSMQITRNHDHMRPKCKSR